MFVCNSIGDRGSRINAREVCIFALVCLSVQLGQLGYRLLA